MLRVLRPALRVRGAAPRALSSAPPAGPHIVPDELVNSNGGLLEYSVVYTDRAMNHMSAPFGVVMRELHEGLCSVYNTEHAVLIPGSGTYGMEAVARQFGGHGRKCMAIRNGARGTRVGVFVARAAVCVCVCTRARVCEEETGPRFASTPSACTPHATPTPVAVRARAPQRCACAGYFSYRWSQIFDQCLGAPEGGERPGAGQHAVVRARPVDGAELPPGYTRRTPYAPPPLEEVQAAIARERPELVCAPHVETSLGILLPDDYIRGVADAVRARPRGGASRAARTLP